MPSPQVRAFGAVHRKRILAAAFMGSLLPMAVATATDFSAHPPVFFVGAIGTCAASLAVVLVPRRHRVPFYLAAYGGLPCLAMLQADSGGAASGYSVLLMMPMVWFGLQATDRELVVAGGGAGCLLLPADAGVRAAGVSGRVGPRDAARAGRLGGGRIAPHAQPPDAMAHRSPASRGGDRRPHRPAQPARLGGHRPPRARPGEPRGHARGPGHDRPRRTQGAQRHARARGGRPRAPRDGRPAPPCAPRHRRGRPAWRGRVRRAAHRVASGRRAHRASTPPGDDSAAGSVLRRRGHLERRSRAASTSCCAAPTWPSTPPRRRVARERRSPRVRWTRTIRPSPERAASPPAGSPRGGFRSRARCPAPGGRRAHRRGRRGRAGRIRPPGRPRRRRRPPPPREPRARHSSGGPSPSRRRRT